MRAIGQPFREDASNADPRFTRNRLRHELLPWLAEQFNPGVKDALLRLGTLAGEAQAVVDALVDGLWETAVCIDGADAIGFDLSKLAEQPPYLVRELLMAAWRRQGWPRQAMGHAQWEQLREMAAAAAAGTTIPQRVFPGNISAEVSGDQLRMTKM